MADKKSKVFLKKTVCYFARPIASKNIFGLMLIPALTLGFLWGFVFFKVLSFIDKPQFQKTLQNLNVDGLDVIISSFPFLIVTFFCIYPICRAVQLLLPEAFDDSEYLELND